VITVDKPGPEHSQLKWKSVALVLMMVCASVLGTAYTLGTGAGGNSIPVVIESGSGVETASYIIYQDGDYTCLKNGTTGKIELRNDNDSFVFQTAIDHTPSGMIYISPDDYLIDYSIYLESNIRLVSSGARLYTDTNGTNILSTPFNTSYIDYLTNISMASSAVLGDRIINAATSGIAVGDIIKIGSSAKYQKTSTHIGEYKEVQQITDATHLVITTPITVANYLTADSANITLVPVVKNITISGLTFQGTSPYDDCVGIALRSAYNTIIESCQFINCGYQAISVDSSVITNINDCKIIGSHKLGNGYGVSVINYADRVTVTSADISYCRHGSSNGGSGYGVPANIRYVGCTFSNGETERQHPEGKYISWEGCTFSNLAAIYIECPYTTLSDCVIYGLTYTPTGSHNTYTTSVYGIMLGHSLGNASNSKIANNHIVVDCGDAARDIISVMWANNTIISGNIIQSIDNTYQGTGIMVRPYWTGFSGAGLIISNNNIIVSGVGIYLYGSGTYPLKNIQIIGNTITTPQRGIYSICDGAIISGNYIKGTGSANGLEINAPNNLITDNSITTTGNSNAVYLYTTADNTIVSNNIINNTLNSAVYARGTAADHLRYCVFSGNILSGLAGNGMKLEYTDYASITGSNIWSTLYSYGILLQSNSNDTKVSNCQYPSTLSIANQVRLLGQVRTVIDGVGNNGANDPASAGEWNGKGYEGLFVKWNNGATHYLSVYRGGAWYDWVVA
jgi:hypothetical protein